MLPSAEHLVFSPDTESETSAPRGALCSGAKEGKFQGREREAAKRYHLPSCSSKEEGDEWRDPTSTLESGFPLQERIHLQFHSGNVSFRRHAPCLYYHLGLLGTGISRHGNFSAKTSQFWAKQVG